MAGLPAACAAALANLEIFEQENLVANAREGTGTYLREKWRALADHPIVGQARMVGLIGSLELCADKATRTRFAEEVQARC